MRKHGENLLPAFKKICGILKFWQCTVVLDDFVIEEYFDSKFENKMYNHIFWNSEQQQKHMYGVLQPINKIHKRKSNVL